MQNDRFHWSRLREPAWVAVHQGTIGIGILVGVGLFTHYLDESEYARLGLALSVTTGLNLLLFGPVSQAVGRLTSGRSDSQAGLELLRAGLRICGYASVLLIAFGAAAALYQSARLDGPSAGLIAVTAVLSAVTGLALCLQSYHHARRARRLVAISAMAEHGLRLLLPIAIFQFHAPDATAVAIGATVAVGLGALPLVAALSKAPEPVDRPAERSGSPYRQIFGYARWLTIFSALSSSAFFLDRWIIAFAIDIQAVAYYYAVSQIASLVASAPASFISQLITPIAFQAASGESGGVRRSERLIARGVWTYAAIMGLAGAIVFAIEDYLIGALSPYQNIRGALTMLMLSMALYHLGQLASTRGLAHLRPSAYLPAKLLHGASFPALCVPFASSWGVYGASLAMLAASAVYLAAVLITNRRLFSG